MHTGEAANMPASQGSPVLSSNPASRSEPTYDTDSRRRFIVDEVRDLIAFRHLIANMVRRDVTARYKRSALGILWTLLDPLLTMVVMAIVFSTMLGLNIPGYPVFLLSGLIVWTFVNQVVMNAMGDLVGSSAILGKVYLPKSIFSATAVGSGAVNLVISLIPMFFLTFAFQRPVTLALLFLPVGMLIVSLFAMGLGLLMSSLAVRFGDMQNVFGILMRLLMYVSAVFYQVDRLPTWAQTIVRLNPIYHMIELFRSPVYNGTFPSMASMTYTVVWALLALLAGFFVFTRLSDEFAYRT